jgi:CDP-glycerol glycerophosphotransferase (TagB/SpsB family)
MFESALKIARYVLPRNIFKYIGKLYFKAYYAITDKKHRNAIARIRKKDKIKVVFFALHSSVWKYDKLYTKLRDHPNFEPLILVCPVTNYGKENMIREMDQCYTMLKNMDYNVIPAYDKENDKYVNVKNSIKPDIIFYTNPYRGLIDDRYYITKFSNILTCYVPYSSMVIDSERQFDKPLTNLLWKSFVENDYSSEMSRMLMKNRGQNVAISGFPSLDVLLDKSYCPKQVWKHGQKIKIIWAPHHTIEGSESITFSNFINFSKIMVDLSKKYVNEIQIAFKPHPLLYIKLLNLWGKERTDNYYNLWDTLPNTQLEKGEYIDLFLTSDAMIFDSCSFLNEYLYTQKPSVFLTNDVVKSQLNKYGLDAFECHQQAHTEDHLIKFIESLIHGYPDPLIDAKRRYYEKYIAMFEIQSASDRIISEIYTSIYNNN